MLKAWCFGICNEQLEAMGIMSTARSTNGCGLLSSYTRLVRPEGAPVAADRNGCARCRARGIFRAKEGESVLNEREASGEGAGKPRT